MENVNARPTSNLVNYKVAKLGKPHAGAKDLIMPAAKDLVKCMLSEQAGKKLDTVPLSNTVLRCIGNMAKIFFLSL